MVNIPDGPGVEQSQESQERRISDHLDFNNDEVDEIRLQ